MGYNIPMAEQDKLTIVAGPTASGKTEFALKLAAASGADLINADSRQIYRGMDIGTNKEPLEATGEELELNGFVLKRYLVDHTTTGGWLFNIVNPDQQFSLAEYQKLASGLLAHLNKTGRKAIIVGGTGLYIDSLIRSYNLDPAVPDKELREKISSYTVDELFDLLWELDPQRAGQLNDSDLFNPRRLVRAIEVASSGGNNDQTIKERKEYEMYYPDYDRDQLYAKIERRVEKMFESGLVDEVKKLIRTGYQETKPLHGIGYKEVLLYLDNEISYNDCVDKIKQGHRNYASRQITWFEGSGRNYNLHKADYRN